jgi:ABC-type molybdate transport system substrate-binding protein
MKRSRILIVLGIAALTLSACSSGGSDAKGGGGATPPAGAPTVAVAAPQAAVVAQIIGAYKGDHPGETVTVSTQDVNTISKTVSTKGAQVAILPNIWLKPVQGSLKAVPFGNAQAAIVVPTANPKNITSTKAFASGSGLRTKVCALGTSFGNLGAVALRISGVTPNPSTVATGCEAAAAAQVAAGTLDAVLVYRNNFKVPAGTKLVSIPADKNLVIDFSYVVLGSTPQAKALGAYLSAPRAQQILTAYGFLP